MTRGGHIRPERELRHVDAAAIPHLHNAIPEPFSWRQASFLTYHLELGEAGQDIKYYKKMPCAVLIAHGVTDNGQNLETHIIIRSIDDWPGSRILPSLRATANYM
ncbi:hypothetical protein GGP41_008270 [Bipolaris sorokiniana]|uniref:Uncharacterized protein n=1 Tax=Cochliobolus sativus TaxID=45130 RepID=A0A8H6DYN8_COCSA|nr:hypothetical protein GGP41_008270 [Bipolaris sorokiniana]